MIEIARDYATGTVSAGYPAAAHCASGDTVKFITRDCFDDSIVTADGPTLPRQFSNPAIGPLYVDGAEIGDVLKIEIADLTVADTGIVRTTPGSGPFDDIVTRKEPRIFRIEGDEIIFDEKLRVPLDIMIGVIATAPADNEEIDTKTPGLHGGNMDCRKITKGSTVYLPVNTPGALLWIGDLHARMGDGEVASCGMECRGTVTVKVEVLKNAAIPTPFVTNTTHWMTVQSAPTLEEAGNICCRKMRDYIVGKSGMDPIAAAMLLSLVGELEICQVVDPLMTVRLEVPVDVFETYGCTAPEK